MDGTQITPKPEQSVALPETGAEQLAANNLEVNKSPVAAETSPGASRADDGAGTAMAQVQIASVSDDQIQVQPGSNPVTATPLVAADVDVIEPEWVKKAEEAVAKHRDDPHAEEAAVEALQIDYLKKRYNLDIKPGDEQP